MKCSPHFVEIIQINVSMLSEYFGKDRTASVSRELTKMFEENKRGTLEELVTYFKSKTVKGEIVIVVGGRQSKEETEGEQPSHAKAQRRGEQPI